MRGFDKLTHRTVPEPVEGTSSQFTDFNQFAVKQINNQTVKQKTTPSQLIALTSSHITFQFTVH